MNTHLFIPSSLCIAALVSGVALAESPVQQAVSKLTSLTSPVNGQAKYYIYLESASWCPHCRIEMPFLVKSYPEMQKAGVELILLSADRSEKKAASFVTAAGGNFPVVMGSRAVFQSLPSFTESNSIPNATIIDANGKVLKSGHASFLKDWKSIIK